MIALINALRQHLFFKLLAWLQDHEYKTFDGNYWRLDMTWCTTVCSVCTYNIADMRCAVLGFRLENPQWRSSAIDWRCHL